VVRNVYATRTNAASVRYRVHPDWFVEGAIQDYGATQSYYTNSNVNVREERAVLVHVRPNGDQFQLRWISRRGDYPNQTGGINYQYEEHQLDALMTMVLSGASSVTGSFGRLNRSNPYRPERDFTGQIGRLAWNWLPTGKLSLNASIERSLGAKEDMVSTFALTDTLSVGATWAATEKIQFQFGLSSWRSDFRSDPGVVPPGWLVRRRKDDGNTISLGASYQIMRNVVTSLQFVSSRRDSNYPRIPFRDETLWLNANWSI
jgi:hypothetical protein